MLLNINHVDRAEYFTEYMFKDDFRAANIKFDSDLILFDLDLDMVH